MSNNTEVTAIKSKLKKIMYEVFEFNLDLYGDELYRENLLGRKVQFQARDLLYLLYCVEKEFGISVPQKDIIEDRFNNLDSIADIISGQLSRKEACPA